MEGGRRWTPKSKGFLVKPNGLSLLNGHMYLQSAGNGSSKWPEI
ncbi:hypothetical protein CCACVL1_25549 [Corchorus capsularis]|uniref:Uncharacterized protein n=1 Tax=Corchorus capsularis TaxID=210143 RepID=A0A1R3GJB6_COCAP|nr:hypothetical protein CCACVL1_25549 [Corchorus capsularis]